MPVALENITKAIGVVVHSSKAYVCVMQLHGDVGLEEIKSVASEFTGTIYQRPPVRSNVRRALRLRSVFSIDVLETRDRLVLLRIESDPGTYMRKLCWDMGLVLGAGAHMRELRRIKSGPFTEDNNLVTLHQISEAVFRWREEGKDDMLRKAIMPGEVVMCEMPKIVLRDTAVESVVNGAYLAVPGIAMLTDDIKRGSPVAMFTLKGELVGLGEAIMDASEVIKSERGIAAKPKRIVMPHGVYPRAWGKVSKPK
ncbi:MAG: RNA-guided pseudouridylation complex pseudouridine synthase subunit Cbf5 [Acidilobus sp.]